jgi:hypothetical protein
MKFSSVLKIVCQTTSTSEAQLPKKGEVAPNFNIVTLSFKVKTEYISLCVLESSFTHKAINSEINSISSIYYIESYYKILL